MIEREKLLSRIKALGPWFHAIDFGGGVRAERDPIFGSDRSYPLPLWDRLKPMLPPNVRGMSVLDVGCNGGFFSVELKRAGAARVVGLETAPQFLAQAELVRDALGLDLDLRGIGVYDLEPSLGAFDLTLFLGVVYHLKNPLLGLEKVAAVTKGTLVIESAIAPPSNRPSTRKYLGPSYDMLFIENGPGAEGLYNWFIPTFECLKALLRVVGFGRFLGELQDGERAIIVAQR